MDKRVVEAVKVLRRQSKLSFAEIGERLGISEAQAFSAADSDPRQPPEGAVVSDYDDIIHDPEALMEHEARDDDKVEHDPEKRKALLLSDKPLAVVAAKLGMQLQMAQMERMRLRRILKAAERREIKVDEAIGKAAPPPPADLGPGPIAPAAAAFGIEYGVPAWPAKVKRKYTRREHPMTNTEHPMTKEKKEKAAPPPPAGDPDALAAVAGRIMVECENVKNMLLEKNSAYGNSALDPVRVFSKASPVEQLLVRIDDKLSRLARGKEFPGEDTVNDLIGYLILLKIAGVGNIDKQFARIGL